MRLSNRVQLTSDGHKPCLEAVEQSFGADAVLIKVYGNADAPAGAPRLCFDGDNEAV
jgi:hypothetical protein